MSIYRTPVWMSTLRRTISQLPLPVKRVPSVVNLDPKAGQASLARRFLLSKSVGVRIASSPGGGIFPDRTHGRERICLPGSASRSLSNLEFRVFSSGPNATMMSRTPTQSTCRFRSGVETWLNGGEIEN